jgi:hypothetical protein
VLLDPACIYMSSQYVVATQASRSARRLFLGNLPACIAPDQPLTADLVQQYFDAALIAAQLHNTSRDGKPVVTAQLLPNKQSCFLELRSMAEATSCLALNGIDLGGKSVRAPVSALPRSADAALPLLSYSDPAPCIRPQQVRLQRPSDYTAVPASRNAEMRRAGLLGSTSMAPDAGPDADPPQIDAGAERAMELELGVTAKRPLSSQVRLGELWEGRVGLAH